MSEKLMTFLKDNPNSTKEAITTGTELRGLFLFNLLKKLQTDGVITSMGEGQSTTYSLVMMDDVEQEEVFVGVEEEREETIEVEEQPGATPMVETPAAVTKGKAGRDNSKFNFEGMLYGKGPLVRTIVAKHVQDNPGITYEELKAVFPDTLLKRFGIFQDVNVLTETPKMKDRYFCKEEQQIKLKDKKIIVCNQFTFDNIQPFLVVAKQLGYEIE